MVIMRLPFHPDGPNSPMMTGSVAEGVSQFSSNSDGEAAHPCPVPWRARNSSLRRNSCFVAQSGTTCRIIRHRAVTSVTTNHQSWNLATQQKEKKNNPLDREPTTRCESWQDSCLRSTDADCIRIHPTAPAWSGVLSTGVQQQLSPSSAHQNGVAPNLRRAPRDISPALPTRRALPASPCRG